MAAPAYAPLFPSVETIDSPRNLNHHHRPVSSPYLPPQGACNFKDLSLGHTCGCRRFWSDLGPARQIVNGVFQVENGSARAWCFCGHHACFHAREERMEGDGAQRQADIPRTPIGMRALNSFGDSEGEHQHRLAYAAQQSSRSAAADASIYSYNNTYNGSRHTIRDARMGRLSALAGTRPPSQSSSRPASMSDSVRQPRASPSRKFMSQVINARSQQLVGLSPSSVAPRPINGSRSPTELATPSSSIVGSPTLRAADATIQAVHQGLDRLNSQLLLQQPTTTTEAGPGAEHDAMTLSERLLTQMSSLRAILLSVPNLSTSLNGLTQRVNALENVSFGQGSVEELHDRYDHLDGRILDVEGKLEEMEKVRDATSVHDSDHPGDDTSQYPHLAQESLGPDQNRDSSSGVYDDQLHRVKSVAPYDLETLHRLESLESRLTRFETCMLPSPAAPWEIEVVLLPWGPAMKGLWSSMDNFAQSSSSSPLESDSLLNGHESIPAWRPEPSTDWYFARACGPTTGTFGKVYGRLKSRGFVRNITVRNNSAREVEFEIMWAFEAQLRALNDDSESIMYQSSASAIPPALSNPWIPLRKVHRSSRLRFLTTAELATPALWTAEFLNASALMKAPMAGKRRLFITHPAAYLQRRKSPRDWSWRILRGLTPLRQKNDNLAAVVAGSQEPCWQEDSRLDPPSNNASSFAASSSSGSVFGSSFASPPPSPRTTLHHLAPRNSVLESDPMMSAASRENNTHSATFPPCPGLGLRHISSGPIATTEDHVFSPPTSKRLIASFDDTITGMSPIHGSPSKRRRLSKAPSGDGIRAPAWGFTPRLSREPPSPAATAPQHIQSTQHPDGVRAEGRARGQETGRGVTPSAYATPFSHSTAHTDFGYAIGGDTDVDEGSVSSVGDRESNADGGVDDHDRHGRGGGNYTYGNGHEAANIPSWRVEDEVDHSESSRPLFDDIDDEGPDDDVWEGVEEE